jgi:DNA-binding transcriptional LysR family regulator
VTLEEVGRQIVIAHNDPSPTRDRVLRAYERRQTSINIQISLPSLDGIKRAVEMGIGVALLPRRCALTEIARRHRRASSARSSAPRGRCVSCSGDRRAQPRRRGVPGRRQAAEGCCAAA